MILLTDGTVMALSDSDYQTWLRLTPDSQGSYTNGTWTISSKMNTARLDFASQVLPNGKLWILGGEYSGPGIPQNEGYTGEIFDPLTNAWTPAAPLPNLSGCTTRQFGGVLTSGSAVISGIISTAGWQAGWAVTPLSGTAIPGGATIASVDSPTEIHISGNATSNTNIKFSLNPMITGTTTAGSNLITGIASTADIQAGWPVSGPGIPAGTTIQKVSSTSVTISHNATLTASDVDFTLTFVMPAPSCAGDMISILLPGPKIMAGPFVTRNTYLYDPGSDTWTQGASKAYPGGSAEESWVRLANGTVLTYDIFQSEKGTAYAELYDPAANKWSPISPADGTAKGTLPLLSSTSLGDEIGPFLHLYDDRIFAIGGNGHTALYTPSTNTWAAGPDMIGTLGGLPFLFAADDAPAAILPNGHVLLVGDAGNGIASTGSLTSGSPVVTNLPSTAQIIVGWAVAGAGIPSGATVKSVDSPSQVTLSANVTASGTGVAIQFAGTFSAPTQIFDFDPEANTISAVSPALNDTNLASARPGFTIGMLTLPTGQVLLSDDTTQLWIYTPDGTADSSLRPTVASIASKGGGVFTLSGAKLTGQSAGSAYGDDEQNDTNYPIVSMTSTSGTVSYARTTNWSYLGVAGTSPQTVDFTLHSQMLPGNYSLVVSGAGIQSNPVAVTLSSDLSTIAIAEPPQISNVLDAAGSRNSVVPGQWIAVYGEYLANSSRPWSAADFTGGTAPGSPLPTTLDGVRVTIGGQAAAVYYISPTQLNVQVPAGLPSGAASVLVMNGKTMSSLFTTTITQISPAFFPYAAGSNFYVAAVHADGTLVGDPSVSSGTPAHPGEIIETYVSGIAPSPSGTIVQPTSLGSTLTITAGSHSLAVQAVALVAAGEFQVNVQLPADIPTGTYPLVLTLPGGTSANTGTTVLLPVVSP